MLIGEVGDQFSVTSDTLRYYDRIGLLSPRRRSGLRRYSPADLNKLTTILKMKSLMFTLDEIRTLLSADAAVDRSLRQAQPDQTAVRELLNLAEVKLAEMDALEEKIKAVKKELWGYVTKIKGALEESGKNGG